MSHHSNLAKDQERRLLADQWNTLAVVLFVFCAANEIAALVVVKSGAFEILLDLIALAVGFWLQWFLFGSRFFMTQADRRIFGPRRFAMVFGGAFKEGFRVPTFWERAGQTFPWRVAGVILGGGFFLYALANARWLTIAMLFNVLLCAFLLVPFDFWRPLVWSLLFLLFNVISHYDSASGMGLLAVVVAGAELLFFGALQNHLDRRSQTLESGSPPPAPFQPVTSWLAPLFVFAVATILVYPLMRGQRIPPLPEAHWTKRMSEGLSGRPSLSSVLKKGEQFGDFYGADSRMSVQGREQRFNSGGVPGSSNGFRSGGGRKPNLGRNSEHEVSFGDSFDDPKEVADEGGQARESASTQSEEDVDPEKYRSKLQNLAKFGKNAADRMGGGAHKDEPAKATAKQASKFKLPKLELKRVAPLLVLFLAVAGIIALMFMKRKKEMAAQKPVEPVITRAQQVAALRKLEEQLARYAGNSDCVSTEEVVETYHIFLEFLKDHEAERPEYATPDEFAVDVGMITKRKEIQPLTRVFCGTLYGRRSPSRAEFDEYLANVREVARAVHDEVRR